MNNSYFRLIAFTLFSFCVTQTLFAQRGLTTLSGKVVDSKTGEGLPGVNLVLEGTNAGTITDDFGNFNYQTRIKNERLKVTFVGYGTQTIKIVFGEYNNLTINLVEGNTELKEVVVKVEKYKNKGNPAVELIRRVIAHKEQNHKSGLDYYSYKKYEKVEFGINNVTDKMRNNFLWRNLKFMFNNVDTNKITNKVLVPIYLREIVSDVFYRKTPKSLKEFKLAEKHSDFNVIDKDGASNYIDNMYQEVDIYDPSILLVTNSFMSPLNDLAPDFYRFYILDTVKLKNDSCITMYFGPRNKSDISFQGKLWIAKDSTYAVRKVEMGFPKEINLNWLHDMYISQEYDFLETATNGKALIISKDSISMDFSFNGKDSARTVQGKKTTMYADYSINKPIKDSIFKADEFEAHNDKYYERGEEFWQKNRIDSLTKSEGGIYGTMAQLNKNTGFRIVTGLFKFLFDGYIPIGNFDMGPTTTFISFNDVEGTRLRFGGRTSPNFSNTVLLEAIGSYGTKDQKFKYVTDVRINFSQNKILRFPLNQLKLYYNYDTKTPGLGLSYISEDNILLSVKRGINDKIFYIKDAGFEYTNENRNGFSYTIGAKNVVYEPGGGLKINPISTDNPTGVQDFVYYNQADQLLSTPSITTSEVDLKLRYAPHDKFYQGANYRTPILTKFPIFTLKYAKGFSGILNSQYDYNKVDASVERVFWFPLIGFADVIVEGGRTFGTLPYPLLTIHRANQTYSYQMESYNLMNFMEFISDKYASVNVYYNMGGFLFNRVPLLKRLKWREAFTFKGIWGGLDAANNPSRQNGQILFPTDAKGVPLSYSLNAGPYMEAGVGVTNILKFLRVDYIWRLSYLNNPNAPSGGIRARVKIDF